MAHVKRFDHVGITVADLDTATAFFVGLGLEVEGTGSVEGEFVETECGIPGAHCNILMLRPPGAGSSGSLGSVGSVTGGALASTSRRTSSGNVRPSAVALSEPLNV